jgi:Raf kinase inhibitor-like YbhB/YbcL family protein
MAVPLLYPLLALTTSFYLTAVPAVTKPSFTLTSAGFKDKQDIPALYTCDGRNIAPEISWQQPPGKVRTYALILEDPDAPAGTWYHWVVYNIPGSTAQIPQGGSLPTGAIIAKNSWGRLQYDGPCPPPFSIHRYVFVVYALDSQLSLPRDSDAKALKKAMEGHVLRKTSIFGVFGH